MKKNFLKTIILGDCGVGKKSLHSRFVHGKFSENTKPTIGADFMKKEVLADETIVTLQMWHTAGSDKYASLGYAFYRGTDCCALCFDLTNENSFKSLDNWKNNFLDNAGP